MHQPKFIRDDRRNGKVSLFISVFVGHDGTMPESTDIVTQHEKSHLENKSGHDCHSGNDVMRVSFFRSARDGNIQKSLCARGRVCRMIDPLQSSENAPNIFAQPVE